MSQRITKEFTMTYARLFARIALIPFTLLTIWALYDAGFVGVIQNQFSTSGGIQVFTDLGIALTFFMIWLVPHAKRTQRPVWPYVLLTLVVGSFGPLLYFALTPDKDLATT